MVSRVPACVSLKLSLDRSRGRGRGLLEATADIAR